MAWSPAEDPNFESKRARLEIQPSLSFSNEDKIETIQPHGDALVVTFRIWGYVVKRVMVDQGRCVEVMYPDLYKGLNLKPEDLTAYDSPLVSCDDKLIAPKGQIRLPIQAKSEEVEVDFIVVDAYSPTWPLSPNLGFIPLVSFLQLYIRRLSICPETRLRS